MNLATTGRSSSPRRTVNGTPSLTQKARAGGGVVGELVRRSPNSDMILPSDLAPLRREAEAAADDARRLSKGTPTRGRNRNRVSINRRSGVLLRSYRSEVARISGGVAIRVSNTAPHADFVMRGTSRIRARGTLGHVMRKRLKYFDREWQAVGRKAAQRQRELEAMRQSGSVRALDRMMEPTSGGAMGGNLGAMAGRLLGVLR